MYNIIIIKLLNKKIFLLDIYIIIKKNILLIEFYFLYYIL